MQLKEVSENSLPSERKQGIPDEIEMQQMQTKLANMNDLNKC